MPLTNLAKVFGPTIVGYSVPDPEPLQMINETKYQAMVGSDSISSKGGMGHLSIEMWMKVNYNQNTFNGLEFSNFTLTKNSYKSQSRIQTQDFQIHSLCSNPLC